MSFVFSVGGTNPSVVADAGTFTVSTYSVISSTPYPIDNSSFTNVFTPTPGILNATVTPDSYVAYNSPTNYTFSITPIKSIPQNGYVIIIFPTQITGTSITSCSASIPGSSSSVSCSLEAASPF